METRPKTHVHLGTYPTTAYHGDRWSEYTSRSSPQGFSIIDSRLQDLSEINTHSMLEVVLTYFFQFPGLPTTRFAVAPDSELHREKLLGGLLVCPSPRLNS